jgi:hypothetical protein
MWVDYCHANEVACGFEKITGCVSGDLGSARLTGCRGRDSVPPLLAADPPVADRLYASALVHGVH